MLLSTGAVITGQKNVTVDTEELIGTTEISHVTDEVLYKPMLL